MLPLASLMPHILDVYKRQLLKTIEEPPAYGIIMLLTSNIDAVLPTIRSRCVTLNLRPVEFEKIRDYLMEKYEVPDYQAKICAAFSQGNVGTVSYTHLDVYKRQG